MSTHSKDGLLAMTGSLLGLSTLAVGLRFFARKRQKLAILADDYLAVLGLISYIGAAATIFYMVHKKYLGYSSFDFTKEEAAAMAEGTSKSEIAQDIFTNLVLACTKLSILFFYRRVFCAKGACKWLNVVIWVTITIVVLWLVVFQFLTGFQCGTHFSALWSDTYLKYCTLSFPFLYGLTISDFLLECWILALPIPRIMALNTTTARKLSIVGLFLLGFVGLGAAGARMAQYIKIELGGPDYLLYQDEEKLITSSIYLTLLEAGMSLVAINLPSIWILVVAVKPEAIVASVRSFLELSSLRSRGSSERVNAQSTNNSTSNAQRLPSEDSTAAFPRKDLEAQHPEAFMMKDKSESSRYSGESQIHEPKAVHTTTTDFGT